MKLVSNIDKVNKSGPREPIYWDVMDSPLGEVYAAVDKNGALKLLSYGDSLPDFMGNISRLGQSVRDAHHVEYVFAQLNEYFTGQRNHFDLPVNLEDLTSFRQKVLEATQGVLYGQVTSYKAIASTIGQPGAARAVGGALANNPVGIIVPCHRVVAADGSLGGFSGAGGSHTKRFLLELERGE